LVPIRSPEAIAEKIAWFADQRAELPRMRQYAIDKAAKYTWERYGDRIADIVRLHSKTANHANVG
jgi:glycosyltransferase involved in cell wall biosynthesis